MVDTTPSSDVPAAWLMGVSWGWLTPGRIKDQPCEYGTIMTMRRDIDAQQLLIAPSGETWSRGSRSATQAWGAFIKLGQFSLSQCIRYYTGDDAVDLNDLTENGLFSYINPENRPSGARGWVNVLVSKWNDNPYYVNQLAMTSNGVFFRMSSSGVWGEWTRLQHSLSRITIAGCSNVEFLIADGPYFVQRYNFSGGDYYQITFSNDGIRVQHKTETLHKASWDSQPSLSRKVSLGVRASSAAVYCDSQYSQRVMVNVTDSENGGAYILVAADGYIGLYDSDSASWVGRADW